jgi:transcriptional regulator with XRE-family HTH domain
MTNKEKFLQLVDHHDSTLMEKVKYRVDNNYWIRQSQTIVIKAFVRINELGWSQKQLAQELKVSPQYVSKLLSGQENMTLETIVKLQTLLDIPLLVTYNEAKVNELEAKVKRLEKRVIALKTKLNPELKPSNTLVPPKKKNLPKKSNVV